MSEELTESLVNYLRIHRRNAGLSQTELGRMLGYRDETAVANHERFESIPPFLIALSYEIVFQVPASELFAGLKETLTIVIEERLAEFEHRLREKGSVVLRPGVAKTLEWLHNRRVSGTEPAQNPSTQ